MSGWLVGWLANRYSAALLLRARIRQGLAMASGYLIANGGTHYYDDTGEGSSAVVFIPGYTLDTRMWDRQSTAFAPRHRVVRYDLRGAGKSASPTGPYAYHDDLKALLDHLQIAQAHIVGLSLGGAIAVDFALAYPGYTLSLVPADTSALGGYPWPELFKQWFAPISAAAARGDIAAAKKHWLETGWFVPALRNKEVAAELAAILAEYSGWHFHNRNPIQSLDPPANERLEEIKAPTLVIVGELDLPFYNLPIADSLASRIPHARKVVIPSVGHMANMEAPQQFNDAVLSFIARVDATLGS